MTHTPDIQRPTKALLDALKQIDSATATGELARLGIRDAQIRGPLPFTRGRHIVGPALTLQMMPKREDQYNVNEYTDPEKQLHRHVLYHAQKDDIVCVDARGDMASGIFGEMMLTYFAGRGGAGVVIDGCIRDYPFAKDLGLGLFLRGATPNYHTQTGLFPFAVNVPIAMNNQLVMPGDIIIADDDGVVVVPISLAGELAKKAGEHHEWEVFSKENLEKGGDLRKYYPLNAEAKIEFAAWQKKRAKKKK